jgi:hypothetical protein
MSRNTITVTGEGRTDPEAVIGYDPPLQTFFLQAFPHEETNDPALWIDTRPHEFEKLDHLHRTALAEGYDFMPLPAGVAKQLSADKARNGGRPPL